ncbi:SDR family oxidoreductase [Nocardia cyriacigeorgica]|uniref:SDR family NAD(P)-dependent oxidoreductase n=1 Tax=Nocardia cyriacigeorgica TaxID=135487 RepID=UPI0013BA8867|nr:SDR family oxidoreductase [Nocardia cyriacigeorgica]NEW51488.1 SDR family oxidoreductase [Nocardia cyriacigeorgica]
MRLDGKNAVVYGAAGQMGGAVARAFAEAGARVYLVGRTRASLEVVAAEIAAGGGRAEVAVVDVFDQAGIGAHAEAMVEEAGSLDISFNAVGMDAVQDVPLVDITLEDFMSPIVGAARSHFITTTTAARQMSVQGSGVIVLLSATAAGESRHRMGGFNVACAGIEALNRSLAGELGPEGVRVVCIRANFTPETMPELAEEDSVLDPLIGDTRLGRLPRLAEVAHTAVYAASDSAGAMTGAVLNLSCGALVD